MEQWQERLPHGSQTPFMISAQRPARNLVSAGSGDGEDGDCDIRREIRAEIQKAVECLIKDLETLLLFFDFSADHWDHLRTKNPIVKRVCDGQASQALVMLSDILPTGFECGVLNGKVAPGRTVAIVGEGPIGLAALLTAQFYSPAEIIMIDLDDNRLKVAKRFGATAIVNATDGKAAEARKTTPTSRKRDIAPHEDNSG